MGLFGGESKFESSIKQVPYPQEAVYRNISDLSNLEKVRDRIPEDKINDFSFDEDTVTLNVQPVGELKLRICDREEPKCVKFETVQSPVPFNVWIQVLPREPSLKAHSSLTSWDCLIAMSVRSRRITAWAIRWKVRSRRVPR